MYKVKFIFLLGVAALALGSCEPQPDQIKLLDQFVVLTNREEGIDFTSFSTYATNIDTIGLISNSIYDDTIIVGTSYARPVIQRVTANMNSLNYSQVDKDQDPDVFVNIYVVKNLDIYTQYNSYYNPYYYGYYGYYYGPTVSTYAYNTGLLVVEMADLKNPVGGKIKVVWTAQMGDVFSSVDLLKQTNEGIDQAFDQSLYLDAGL